MDIGPEKPPFIAEPLEDPFKRQPLPAPEPKPPAREPVREPAKTGSLA